VNALALVLLLQSQVLDEGTFIVREDTVEVAREAFRLSAGRIGHGGAGWTLAITSRYDRVRPIITIAPILQICCDTVPSALQYDVAGGREPVRILGQLGGGRFTVRFVTPASERAREFPGNGPTVVLDDSVFAFYTFVAWRAGPQRVTVTAIVARGLRRESLVVEDHGATPGPDSSASPVPPAPQGPGASRAGPMRRHVTVTGGPNGVVHLWLDSNNRLMRIEIPSRRLTVERAQSG
jgi:hypothetical protein